MFCVFLSNNLVFFVYMCHYVVVSNHHNMILPTCEHVLGPNDFSIINTDWPSKFNSMNLKMGSYCLHNAQTIQ